MKKIRYGNSTAIETSAAGVTGLLCKSLDGTFFFRVTGSDGELEDYCIRHDDMKITINADESASFYKLPNREDWLLDHPSTVLGLEAA
jgi:hypothetical protein